MTWIRASLILTLLLTVCFTLATWLDLHAPGLGAGEQTDSLLQVLLGNGRQMFAKQFATEADVYFHRGYYPSIFDQARAAAAADSKHMTEEHDEAEEKEHEKAMNFLGEPKDWIDRFGRNFYSSTHSHLDGPGEAREILPWLKISTDLDPKQVDSYLTASFFLRKQLGKVDEAQQYLREGLRANPTSYEILFELGKLEYENKHDLTRARNLWEAALRRWHEQETAGQKPEPLVCDDILAHLAHLEEEQGNLPGALSYLEQQEKVSPQPDVIRQRIDELKRKMPK